MLEDTTTGANQPATNLSAADYLGRLTSSEDDAPLATQPGAQTEEQTTDEDSVLAPLPLDESDDPDAKGIDEDIDVDGDDEESYELPALLPEIANNAEALAKVKNFEKGVQKIVQRAKAKEAELAEMIPRVQQMSEWGDLLANKDTVASALADLVSKLSAYHQIPLNLTGAQGAPNAQVDDEDWESAGFDSPGEYRAYKRAISEIETKYGPKLGELDAMKQERQKASERKQFEDYLAEQAPRTIKLLAKADNGWTVTSEMVAEAVRNLPQFAKTPAKAVQMYFSDERAKHYARLQSEGKKQKPDMVDGGRASGHQLPPVGQRTALDYMKLNGLA